jgi:hypothetical protein
VRNVFLKEDFLLSSPENHSAQNETCHGVNDFLSFKIFFVWLKLRQSIEYMCFEII